MDTRAGVAGPFTASLWVREPVGITQVAWTGLMGQVSDFAWSSGWGMFLDDAQQLSCFVEAHTASRAVVSGAFHPTAWTHVVCLWDTFAVKIYLDGVLAASIPHTGGMTAGHPLWVGTLAGPTAFMHNAYWQGWISDPLLYSRALSPAEIQALYALQLSGDAGLLRHTPNLPLLTLATLLPPTPAGPQGRRGGAGGVLLRR